MNLLREENQKLKSLFEIGKSEKNDQCFSQKLFYFAKLNQHAYYDFEGLRWNSFKVYDRKISEGKIVVIDKCNVLIIGGYETDQFDWS